MEEALSKMTKRNKEKREPKGHREATRQNNSQISKNTKVLSPTQSGDKLPNKLSRQPGRDMVQIEINLDDLPEVPQKTLLKDREHYIKIRHNEEAPD